MRKELEAHREALAATQRPPSVQGIRWIFGVPENERAYCRELQRECLVSTRSPECTLHDTRIPLQLVAAESS